MNFTESYKDLKSQFYNSDKPFISSTGTRMRWIDFSSCKYKDREKSQLLRAMRSGVPGISDDERITQNRNFSYPVFMPRDVQVNNGSILLLHGLNERKWDKYLTWADYLATKTGKSVILFPISFHINRSKPDWTNRHLMKDRSEHRKKIYSLKDTESTLINEALSERLTEAPERLFLSGYQTSEDIVQLLTDIYEGRHPLFTPGTHSDIFAYSIGGLLAQVLYIANPDELFSNSKLFLFCAGSLFGNMNGISKLIMDPVAHFKLQDYYRIELEHNIKKSSVWEDFFTKNRIGLAFRSMITQDRLRGLREKVFHIRREHIQAISLKKDRIIPANHISEALMGTQNRLPSNMEVLDFAFPYSHEIPFPVNKEPGIQKYIDEAFELVFSRAALFLS